jgi:hypothetical protein
MNKAAGGREPGQHGRECRGGEIQSVSPRRRLVGQISLQESFRETQQRGAFRFGAGRDLRRAIQRRLDVLPEFNGPGGGDPYGLHGNRTAFMAVNDHRISRVTPRQCRGAKS